MPASSGDTGRHRRPAAAVVPKTAESAGSTADVPAKNNTHRRSRLLHWDDLPLWRRDNHFIHSGYRPTSNSYAVSLASVAAVHNESVNIWTHLAGAVVAAVIGASLYVEVAEPVRWWVFGGDSSDTGASSSSVVTPSPASSTPVLSCFLAGAVTCLGMSATYHALGNHSPAVARWGNKLDYSGIVFLIMGSYVPTLYYGFFCHPWWMTLYLNLIALLGFACLVVSWLDHFRTPAWRAYRAMLFVGLGVSGVVPILHALFVLEGQHQQPPLPLSDRYARLNDRIGLNWVLLQGGLYILGAVLYAARWPERWRPGRFDLWGSSHQIFHVFVLLAAAAHLRGVVQGYTHHQATGGACEA